MKKIIAFLVLGCVLLAYAAPVYAVGSGCGHCRNCRNCYCTDNGC
jgi:hypothetical protein